MEFRVTFDNYSVEYIETSFPSLAARFVAERLNLDGDRTCEVQELDGTVTHWKVTRLTMCYVRPFKESIGGIHETRHSDPERPLL
jgi:hypothetical protein